MYDKTSNESHEAQVHIFEMLTLFWLFFMSAIFLIQVDVPDSASISLDGGLEMGGQDALRMGISETPVDPNSHDSRLGELLSERQNDQACNLVLESLPSSMDGNCWLAMNGESSDQYGSGGEPIGRTVAIHMLLQDSGDMWTVTLNVWYKGGGA